jgi:hypothetical protein
MTAEPLIVALKSMIERSYGMPRLIPDLAPFLIGDQGYAALYGARDERETAATPAAAATGARVLVRQTGPPLRLALYYPDALVRHLERFNPQLGLGDVNIDAFGALIEELDHLLTLSARAAEGRPISLLELEHHANVTKYLMVLHFLGRQTGRSRLPDDLRLWARHHVFEKYSDEPGEGEERYRKASGLASKYVRRLEPMSVEQRHAELRDFQRRPFADTCRLLAHVN